MITNQMLATYPFLGRLSADSRRLVEASVRVLAPRKGECLLRKGDTIRGLHLVLAGRLRVYAISPEGGEATLYTIDPGEACPLVMNALLTGGEKRHRTWIEADAGGTRLGFIPLAVFKDLYENDRAVREFALGVLSGRITALMAALEDLNLQPVGQRLIGHLRQRADAHGEIVATHQEVALALGTAREVVSRKLRELGRAGLIRTSRGRIKLLKPQALRHAGASAGRA